MKVILEKEYLKINISDLVSSMDEDACKVFYQELAFEEKLLEACMDFMTSNTAFEDGYHSTTYGVVISRLGDRLKEKLLPLMDEASQHLIKNMRDDLKYTGKELEKLRSHLWRLEREWPKITDYYNDPIPQERLDELKIRKINPPPKLEPK
jgi:hypothetical protein